MFFFTLKKILAILLLPPTSPLLIGIAGLIVRQTRYYRITAALIAFALFSSWLSMTPLAAHWLAATLESIPPPTTAQLNSADAIVVAGSGIRTHSPEYGGATISALALERTRFAARIARQTQLPLLLSGGAPIERPAEAPLMQQVLQEEFGVPVRWVEKNARDTHENAVFSAKILHAEGIKRIVLVTHALHMPRAKAEFSAQGFSVIAAPTGFASAAAERKPHLRDLLPSAGAVPVVHWALREWAGLFVFWLQSKCGFTF